MAECTHHSKQPTQDVLRPEILDGLERLQESHEHRTPGGGGEESQGDPWVLAWVARWVTAPFTEGGRRESVAWQSLLGLGPQPPREWWVGSWPEERAAWTSSSLEVLRGAVGQQRDKWWLKIRVDSLGRRGLVSWGDGRHDSFLIPGEVVNQKAGVVPPAHPKTYLFIFWNLNSWNGSVVCHQTLIDTGGKRQTWQMPSKV